MQLNIIGYAHGNNAEEHNHKQVTHSDIRKMGGVEKAKDDSQNANEHHLQTTEHYERKTYHTG